MKLYGKLISLAILSTGIASSATMATVGFEDLFGTTGSDRDFNDIQVITSGLAFHTTGPYVFAAPVGYSEIPLPDGYYFDYATLIGADATVSFDSIQSAYFASLVSGVKVGTGMWQAVPTSGILNLSGTPGTVVAFGMQRSGAIFYSDPAFNSDGLYHAAVTGIPGNETPEPGTLAMIGFGLLYVAKRLRR